MSVAGPPTKDGQISLAGLSMPGSEPHRFWIPKLELASRASRIELVEKSDFPPRPSLGIGRGLYIITWV